MCNVFLCCPALLSSIYLFAQVLTNLGRLISIFISFLPDCRQLNFRQIVLMNDIMSTSPSSCSLPASVPEDIDAYVNASKTVLKQGEALTVNCTVQGVELVYFSWDIPNRDVSRRWAEQVLLFTSALRLCELGPKWIQDVETHLIFIP